MDRFWKRGLIAALVVAVLTTTGCQPTIQKVETKTASKSETKKQPAKVSGQVEPEYTVLNEDIQDSPIKTQIALDILVSGEISEPGLRALLNRLYEENKERSGFEYHSSPNRILIYAYTDKERAESGMGQWIAMLNKPVDSEELEISVNKVQLSQLDAKPQTRFGLSEDKRRKIFKELVLAEDRAHEEADKQFPFEPTRSMKVGDSLKLTKETPLMPELEPADPLAALQQIRTLSAGCSIEVQQISEKDGYPWYYVKAKSPSGTVFGKGWINSGALMGQSGVDSVEQLRKQGDLVDTLTEMYKRELANRYGLTLEQLEAISDEALVEKDWPFP